MEGRNGLKGASTQGRMGFASADPEVEEFIDFSVDKALGRTHTNTNFLLAPVAGLSARVCSGDNAGRAHCCGILFGRNRYV